MSITRPVPRLVTRPIPRAVTESIGGFTLGDLFPAATSGWAYDFLDTSKIYTDTAGTTPVTAVDQTIARVNDKSGNAVNATQATSTAMPQYFNRYNRLTYSEDFSNAAWTKASAVVNGYTTAPDGTNTAQLVSFSAQFAQIFQDNLFTITGSTVKDKLWIKRITGNTALRIRGKSSTTYSTNITITDEWAEYEADFTHDGTNGVGLGIQDGNAAGHGQIAVWHPTSIRAIYASLPYQRVSNSLYALATRTNDYDTSASFPFYSEHDLVDDKLSLTAPAITGQIAIATTRGLWIDDIAVSAGTFDLGPTTYTGGPAGLLSALGGQIIGHVVRAGTFTQTEINSLLAYYRTKGCPGLITLGAELVTNGTFDANATGWNRSGGGVTPTWSAGTLRVAAGGSGIVAYGPDMAVTAGSQYIVRLDLKGDASYSDIQLGFRRASSLGGFISNVHTPAVTTAYQRADFFVSATTTAADAVFAMRFAGAQAVNMDNASVKALVFP